MATSETAAYTLRPLAARDIFRFANILSKIGIEQLQGIFDADSVIKAVKESGEDAVEAVGVTVVMRAAEIIMRNLPRVESDIYGLLADLSGMTADEVADMPMGDFAGMVVDVLKSEGFRDFFTQARRLLG